MSSIPDKLRRFDQLLRLGLLAPLLAASGLLWAFVLAPLHVKARQAEEQLAQTERLLRAAPAIRREHAELTAQLADLEERAETVRQRIPDNPEEVEFLQQIHQAAEAAQFTLHDYRRGQAVTGDRHSQLEVRLIGSGGYDSLCRFFHRVSQFPRQTQTQNLVIRADPETGGYRLEMSLLLFYRSAPSPSQSNPATS